MKMFVTTRNFNAKHVIILKVLFSEGLKWISIIFSDPDPNSCYDMDLGPRVVELELATIAKKSYLNPIHLFLRIKIINISQTNEIHFFHDMI